MDKETFDKFHFGKHASKTPYKPKHERKWYVVYRVLGPAGPEETFPVYGFDNAKEAVKGCWDYDITLDGKPIM